MDHAADFGTVDLSHAEMQDVDGGIIPLLVIGILILSAPSAF